MARRLLALGFVLAAASAACLTAPLRALACSGPSCLTGALLPASGSLPANALELLWRQSRDWTNPDARPVLHVYKLLGGRRSELPVTMSAADETGSLFRVALDVPVAAGSELVLEADEVCPPAATLTSSLQVGPAAPAPSSLGRLEVEEQRQGELALWVNTGECYRPFSAAYATLRVELADTARPFADVLRYAVRVDGAVFASQEAWSERGTSDARPLGTSAVGRGKERLYHVCGAIDGGVAPGLAAGAHRVQMFAQLPDGRTIDSDEIAVELRCDTGAPSPAPGAGMVGGGRSDAEIPVWIEAETAPVVRPGPDAGAPLDAGGAADAAPPVSADAAGWATDDEPPARVQRGAVQCSPLLGARAGRSVLWATFLLLMLLVTLRTKRRLRAPGSLRQSGGEARETPAARA